MTTEEEARLMARVMEDSMYTHDERQWEGLEEMTTRSATGEVSIPEEEEPVAAFQQLRRWPPAWA